VTASNRRIAFVAGAALGALAGIAHLSAEVRGADRLALLAKPVPVLLLATAVLLARRSPLRMPVGAGLAVSAVADVLIQRPGGFLAGLATFLVAHLCYTLGFWRGNRSLRPAHAVPYAIFGAFMAWRLAPGLAGADPRVAAGVGAYIVAISAMMWRASALRGAPGLPPRTGTLALAGAILFAASDSLIAVNRFLVPLSWANVPIMVLYWAGQLGIAGAALASGRGDRA
jgi:uncharacterized membrane protein YhhN